MWFDKWFNDVLGTTADRNNHGIVLGATIQALGLKSLQNCHTGMEPLHTLFRKSDYGNILIMIYFTYGKFAVITNDDSFVTKNGDERKIMPFANLVVVGVMSWGDLDSTLSR